MLPSTTLCSFFPLVSGTVHGLSMKFYGLMPFFVDNLVPETIASKIAMKQSRRDKVHELLLNYNTVKDKK